MITAVRSALICESVARDGEGRVNYIGVMADRLAAASRPGLIECHLALVLDVDRRATEGFVRVRAEGFAPADAAISIPAGWSGFSLGLPMLVPVLAEGPLRVEVHDQARRLKPFKVRWGLEFAREARELGPEAAAEFIRAGQEAGGLAALGLQSPRGRKPN